MFPLCFVTSYFVGDPLAARLAARLQLPKEWPICGILARSSLTVCVMCPAMSLWATVLFQPPRHRVHPGLAPDGGLQLSHGVLLADLLLRPAGAEDLPDAGALRGGARSHGGSGGMTPAEIRRPRTRSVSGAVCRHPSGWLFR